MQRERRKIVTVHITDLYYTSVKKINLTGVLSKNMVISEDVMKNYGSKQQQWK